MQKKREIIKVLHILWSGEIGGAQKAVYQLVKGQLRAKSSMVQPSVIFGKAEGLYFKKINELGCKVIEAKLKRDGSLLHLSGIVKKMKPFDIHHFHSTELTFALASTLCNVKRVYTHRGGIFSYRGKQWFRYKIFGILLKCFFTGFSGNTRHACNSASTIFGIEESKWQLTYNGLEFELLSPRTAPEAIRKKLELPESVFIIATAAQIRKWKRIDLLLQACTLLKNFNYIVLIIGEGPEKSSLEALANKLGIQNKVIFCGKQEHIGDLLQIVDVFVQPSLSLESFGNATVEAMSLGIPVIVMADGGGLTEHIVNEVNGFIVHNFNEIAEKITQLYNNPSLKRLMGTKAKNFVQNKYTVPNMLEAYEHLYKSVYYLK